MSVISVKATDKTQADWRFSIRIEQETAQDPGLLMSCPSHAHGTSEKAMAKLRYLRRRHLATKPEIPTKIWICRLDQWNTVERFAKECDITIINPFATTPPSFNIRSGDVSGFAHPFLKNERHVVQYAKNGYVWACVPIAGETSLLKKPNYEEIKWMVFSAIGSGCKGIIYRGNAESIPELHNLNDSLLRIGPLLTKAKPVYDLKVLPGTLFIPLALRISNEAIILVLLDRSRLNTIDNYKLYTKLPSGMGQVNQNIQISLPKTCRVESIKQLDDQSISYTQDKNILKIPAAFGKKSEILIIKLSNK